MTITQNKNLIFQDLGTIDYQKAFDYQEGLMKSVIDLKLKNRDRTDGLYEETPNYFLLLEHPHEVAKF